LNNWRYMEDRQRKKEILPKKGKKRVGCLPGDWALLWKEVIRVAQSKNQKTVVNGGTQLLYRNQKRNLV